MAMSRSDNMRRICSKNTAPELTVRRLIWGLGFRGYRIHRKDLPGKPDIAWIGRRLAIFVNGCFWHGHDCSEGIRKPKTNQTYWLPKIERNQARDADHVATLQAQGWHVLVVWDCELKDFEAITATLIAFLSSQKPRSQTC